MAEENSGSNTAIWAIALLVIVIMVVGALFVGGVFNKKATNVDVEIKAPSR